LQPAALSFWIWDKAQLDTVQQRADLTTRRYPQIKVGVEVISGVFWEKVEAALAGGTPPDLLWTNPADFLTRVAKGVFLNLQPYAERDREFKDIIGGCFRSNVRNYLYRCQLHGVPRNAACVGIAYNETLLAREGLRPPAVIQNTWTWDTLLEYARALTKREGGQTVQWGYSNAGAGTDAYCSFLYSNGGRVFDEAATWRCVLGQPAAVGAFEFLGDLVLKHRVEPPPDVAAELGGAAAAFGAGKIAMMRLGSWQMKTFNEVQGLRYDVARVPLSPQTKQSVPHTIGLAAVVAAMTRHPDEAAEVAKRLASVEAQRDVYGEEIPVRPEAAAVWADPKVYPPPNRGMYLESARAGQRLPVHPTVPGSQFSKIISDHLTGVYAGQEAAGAAMRAAEAEINGLVGQAGPVPAGLEACPTAPGVA
jgi:ABC-type glycerol-3-phosphate transport system substrate-binding protein